MKFWLIPFAYACACAYCVSLAVLPLRHLAHALQAVVH